MSQVIWLLDRPVSNSGRLKAILAKIAADQAWLWEIRLVSDPDRVLREADQIVATADSGILDECGRWVNLARTVIERKVRGATIVDLVGRPLRISPPIFDISAKTE